MRSLTRVLTEQVPSVMKLLVPDVTHADRYWTWPNGSQHSQMADHWVGVYLPLRSQRAKTLILHSVTV